MLQVMLSNLMSVVDDVDEFMVGGSMSEWHMYPAQFFACSCRKYAMTFKYISKSYGYEGRLHNRHLIVADGIMFQDINSHRLHCQRLTSQPTPESW